MKPFSPERATEQIAAFYRRVIKRQEQRGQQPSA
jgi:hypothetical protein